MFNNLTTTLDYEQLLKSDRADNERVKKDIKKLMEIIQFKNFCIIIKYNTNDLLLNSYAPAIVKCDSLIKRIETKLKDVD